MNNGEKQQLRDFVSFYKNIQGDIEDLEEQIKEIDIRKRVLISLITNKRGEEDKFIGQLKNKYGESVVNIENLKDILL